MSACIFFGHRECDRLDARILEATIEALIQNGTDCFYVGNQGGFDRMVYNCLKRLRKVYPQIRVSVVLAYLPVERRESEDMSDTMYPEGLESVPPRFAIDRRNRFLLDVAEICVCYVNHTWGGAYKYAVQAKKRGLDVISLGCVTF